ncbi:2-hydroxyacyl-CoA dehydratase family protein, partial [Intrasporangium sp.]|uniref:2-hydroxyacyl-CoA dehydratase family protein n=1 Tax=Intrasporangium sp. TaxID=1925024 RepID=UPI00293AD366
MDAYAEDAPQDAEGHPVVGSVGHDVPVELVWAAGARSVRLRGHPAWDRTRSATYLGSGLDVATASLFAGILHGAFGHLDAIVVSSDCDASQRLYYVMREIRRVEPEIGLPPVYLTDMLHLPRESTARYNVRRLEQFRQMLRTWFRVDPLDRLGEATALSARIVSLQRQFVSVARSEVLRVTGEQALAVFGAAQRLEPRRYAELLAALLAVLPGMPALEAPRLFLTGSSHDRPDVYRQIEEAGWLISGEDHDQGQLALQRRFPEDTPATAELLEVLARVYRDNGPTPQRASIERR